MSIIPEYVNERLDICEQCPHYIKKLRVCGDCKCFLPAKTLHKGSKCPLGKWGEEPLKRPTDD